MNMQNFFVVNSSFNLIKHPEGAVDHKFNLNSSVAPIQNLHTTVRLHLGLEISSHDIVEKIGTFEETYIVPVEFDQDDIMEPNIVAKAIMRQMMGVLANDVISILTKACIPPMPPAVMLNILKQQFQEGSGAQK